MAKNTLAVCNQHVPTKVFPNHGHTIHKYADLPLCPPPGWWDVNTQIFGEKLDEAIVVALWTFLQDSCWANRAPVWLPVCLVMWVSFVYFLFSLPIWKPDSSHCGFRWKQCKAWHQKFHSRQNFVVLPELWALTLYFNPQFVTSKYPNPCMSFLEEEISPET